MCWVAGGGEGTTGDADGRQGRVSERGSGESGRKEREASARSATREAGAAGSCIRGWQARRTG